MSNTAKLSQCPKCGRPIPVTAPQALCPKCVLLGAAQPTEADAPPTGTSEIPSLERLAVAFPQLQIVELIGRGGMGFVFKARQPHLDRFVALKLLPDQLAADAHFAERFSREGRVLARLNHPNIVSVFDFGQTGGFYYLLMEFVDGVNLRQAMRTGRFSPGEALAIVPKICEALQYAHEQGILHRDIKPENILLDTRGRVKIADFGIAKLVGEDQSKANLTRTGAALGTPHYMAPEQLEKPTEVDHRADIYSLGVVFYEMLTGELPLGRFAPPSARTPVDATVDEVVLRTLEKDRERRFQSAGEMKTQVEHLGDGAGPAGAPGESRRLSRWAVVGASSVGVSMLAGLVWAAAPLFGPVNIGPMEFGLIAATVVLPGLAGTLVGWLGLNEIRAKPEGLHGLPLAVFAALAWPILMLGGLSIGMAIWWSRQGQATMTGRLLVFTLPAAAIAFCFWVVHGIRRWVTREPFTRQRGVLKWVFLGVLVTGFEVALLSRSNQLQPAPVLTGSSEVALPSGSSTATPDRTAADGPAMIQFTFTSVDLREDADGQWLSMDVNQQVRGDAERTIRYDARVPGFTGTTRVVSSISDAKPGFEAVQHQRVMWKLPDSLPIGDARALREVVEREWSGKSVAIAVNDERILFKTLVPSGGTLAVAIGVKTSLRMQPAPADTLATLRLIAARDYQNIALARVESLPAHPLHQLIARVQGPSIGEQTSRAPAIVTGPLLVPSLDAASLDPVDGSRWGTDGPPFSSAIRFECPGDYSLQFVLPDENVARDASAQILKALQGEPRHLQSGLALPLFTVGEWKGWLEARPFRPDPERLVFFPHPGRSPARIPGTNLIKSAVITIPPWHQLGVRVQQVVGGEVLPKPALITYTDLFSQTNAGVYWVSWYALPDLPYVDDRIEERWELKIHDSDGRELHSFRDQLQVQRRPVQRRDLSENRAVGAGQSIVQILFDNEPGPRGPRFVQLELKMRPVVAGIDPNDIFQ